MIRILIFGQLNPWFNFFRWLITGLLIAYIIFDSDVYVAHKQFVGVVQVYKYKLRDAPVFVLKNEREKV